MHVSHLSLTDFRNHPEVELPLDPGVTVLVGRNGQGKTNLVEAIGYAASLTSHRVSADAPLVREGAERAIVRVEVVRDARPTLDRDRDHSGAREPGPHQQESRCPDRARCWASCARSCSLQRTSPW